MIGLSSLNGFITLTNFIMEMVLVVLGSIKRGDVMCSIDLKDSYFQTPIHLESCPYLQFVVQGTMYQFGALCSGLFTALQVFARVFALILEWAHRRGIRLLRYFDDWLVVTESIPLLLRHQEQLLQLCQDLEIGINRGKSDFELSSLEQYLRMLIDTIRWTLGLSGSKTWQTSSFSSCLLRKCSIRLFLERSVHWSRARMHPFQ